ncbi:MAG: HIT family protein [Gammaproteobacteria bacterium]
MSRRLNIMSDCPFCNVTEDEVVCSNELAIARFDKYPVSTGHTLIIPIRHIENIDEASNVEQKELWKLVQKVKAHIEEEYAPDGFNIGVNLGEAAGQSIPHLHIHLIPRYQGDMPEPLGGVRGVIPQKQKYSK